MTAGHRDIGGKKLAQGGGGDDGSSQNSVRIYLRSDSWVSREERER